MAIIMSENTIPRCPSLNPFLMDAPDEIKTMNINGLILKVAETVDEVMKAQELRYKVFYEEYGATPIGNMAETKRDHDEFDDVSTHLLVIDTNDADNHKVIGTYRMFRQEINDDIHPFYTEREFDITNLKENAKSLMEVGRSCILDGYRTRFALQLLWQGIGSFIFHHDVDYLFGCASFEGYKSVDELALPLSYLYHYHLAREEIRPKALDKFFTNINIIPKEDINQKEAIKSLPPLIKGYLRLNGVIGDGAMIDIQWASVDVCIMVEKAALSEKHVEYYRRDRSEK